MRDAAFCLILFFILPLPQARAEIITVEATIKAIDANERTITVTTNSKSNSKDIELAVGKEAKVSVAGIVGTLGSIKLGQKVSLSYDTKLEVVTKIEVDDVARPDEPKAESTNLRSSGCRVIWTISETGDSILKVSRPAESREAASKMFVRHEDGTTEFQHEFDSEEGVKRALMDSALMDSAKNVGFSTSFRLWF